MADETPARVVRAMDERDGRTCCWHGADAKSTDCWPGTLVPQHRDGGMGGGADRHRLSNVVWLCSITNGAIEADPVLAEEARVRGIKLRPGEDPAHAPITHAAHGRVVLTDDGDVLAVVPLRAWLDGFDGAHVGEAWQVGEGVFETRVDDDRMRRALRPERLTFGVSVDEGRA